MFKKIRNFLVEKILMNQGIFFPEYFNSPLIFSPIYYLNRSSNVWARKVFQKDFDNLEVKTFQLKYLQILFEAASKISYWNKIFSERGLNPHIFSDLKDIRKLPILTRSIIQELGEELHDQARRKNSYMFLKTSGSTIQPVSFPLDFKCYALSRNAALLYVFKNLGLKDNDSVMRFSYDDLTAPGIYVNLSHYYHDHDLLYRKINDYKPQIMFSNTNRLLKLADWLEKDKRKLSLKYVVATGEQLSRSVKEYFKNVFNAKVFNIYGSREFGVIGQECGVSNTFHINHERFLLEIVNDKNEPVTESSGRILVTFFENTILPFIRYEIGDIGSWVKSDCSCDLKTPRITFEGRSLDFLHLPSGNKYPVVNILHYFDLYYYQYFKQMQLIQNSLNSITLRIVPTNLYSSQCDPFFIRALLTELNESLPIEVVIETVSSIPRLTNGKIQVFISKINDAK